jgi:vitamin B12 transporter
MLKHTLSLVASATLVASLGANTLTVDQIVVTATKTEQALKNTTANVQIITAEELEEKHITSVLDALRSLSSIPVTQNGGLGQTSSFFQRGFSSTNTVVMIDSIRYNDPATTNGQAQLEHLMVNDIERIEIINGAQSGVWGANAVAGVINIITKKPTEKVQVSGNLEYGSYATNKVGANVAQKLGAFSYYIGVNQLKTNGFSALTPSGKNPEDYEADGYTNQTVNAKIGYDITSADTLRAQMTFIDAKTQYDGYQQPNSEGYESHQISRLGSIGYQHKLNSNDSLDVTYAISTIDRNYPKDHLSYKGNNKELNVQGTFRYLQNSVVAIGANTLNSQDTIGAHTLSSKGIFLTNMNRLENLLLTESIRHDAYDTFNDKTTGKIGAKYFFSNDIALSGNYGTAYRTPSLYELYAPASTYFGIVYPLGNINLTPETTKSFDATAQYKHLSATYYTNKVDNLIEYTTGYNNVNGTSTFKGYEVRYNNTFAEILTLDLSYNKLFAKDKNGNYFTRRPSDTIKGSLSYYPTEKLMVGTTASYIGSRPDLDYSTNPYTPVQTGRYTLWSTVVNYDVTSNVTLYLKGENLTNKLYQEVYGYGTAGRSAYAGVNAKF